MRNTICSRALCAIAALWIGQPALSALADSTYPQNEVRGGVSLHDMAGDETSGDLNAQFLGGFAAGQFTMPLAKAPTVVRPMVGGNLNLDGKTNDLYAGYAMTVDVTPKVFVEGSLGAMLHDGETSGHHEDRADLGCRVLARGSAGVGVRLNDRLNVSTDIERATNLGACSPNDGLTNLNVRLGYSF